MIEIQKSELAEILGKHEMWLRGEPGGEQANLREANLSGANLSGANLNWANLREANLSWTRGVYSMQLSKHSIVVWFDHESNGCKEHSIEHWLKHSESIGLSERYSELQIALYKAQLRMLHQNLDNLELSK
jgi:hypothetical protein